MEACGELCRPHPGSPWAKQHFLAYPGVIQETVDTFYSERHWVVSEFTRLGLRAAAG